MATKMNGLRRNDAAMKGNAGIKNTHKKSKLNDSNSEETIL
jgi:hypothetical protein